VTNSDTIVDFTPGADKIVLDHTVFSALTALGALDASHFVVGTPADNDDFIAYDPGTGALSYFASGNGDVGIQFATLTGAPTLAAGDIIVA
jgi:hypothetical protein